MNAPEKATEIKAGVAAILALLTSLWGWTGWAVIIWIGCIILDYISGSAAASAASAANSADAASSDEAEARIQAERAEAAVDDAADQAERAEAAQDAILGMSVDAVTLSAGSNASVSVETSGGSVEITFGIPRGAQGEAGVGLQGPQGVQGPQGPAGGTTAAVEPASGAIYFRIGPWEVNGVTEPGHLLLDYAGDTIPDPNNPPYRIDRNTSSPTYGHLLWDVD